MTDRSFEAGLRRWLGEACRLGHPLAPGWIREHLERVSYSRRLHLPMVEEQCRVVEARVLDLGCGTGGTGVAFALAGARAIGLDRSETLLRLAALRAIEDRAPLPLIQGDARQLPFRSASFDVCVCEQLIEHVQDYPRLLLEVHRILRPGGIAVLAAPHRLALREGHTGLLFASWLPSHWAGRYAAWRGCRMPGEPWDVWLESPWSIRRRIRQAGFLELRSPWCQPRRPATADASRLRLVLARVGPLVRLVRWAFRWQTFLFGTLTFVLTKPSTCPVGEGA